MSTTRPHLNFVQRTYVAGSVPMYAALLVLPVTLVYFDIYMSIPIRQTDAATLFVHSLIWGTGISFLLANARKKEWAKLHVIVGKPLSVQDRLLLARWRYKGVIPKTTQLRSCLKPYAAHIRAKAEGRYLFKTRRDQLTLTILALAYVALVQVLFWRTHRNAGFAGINTGWGLIAAAMCAFGAPNQPNPVFMLLRPRMLERAKRMQQQLKEHSDQA